MKKAIAVLLVVLMVCLTLAGCAGTTAPAADSSSASGATPDPAGSKGASVPAEKKTIALCIAQATNEFQSKIKDAMQKYITDEALNNDYNFTFFDADFDTATQLQQVENAIAQGAAAIVFIAVDTEGSMSVVKAANDAGVPIIGCNTEVADNDQLTSYVGSDCVESGRIEMAALAEAMGGKGKLLELHGTYGHAPQIDRDKGIREVLKKYSDIQIIAEDTANWARDEAMAFVENFFQTEASKEITGIVCHNDAMACGALAALEAIGRDDIMIAGIDANKDMLEYLKEDRVTLTVYQDAKGQGEQAVAQAIRVINGEPYDKYVWIPYLLVDKTNVDEYLALYK